MVFGFMVRLNCNNLYERKNLASNRFRAIFLQATQTSPVGWTGISKKNLWQGQLAKFCYMIPHSSKWLRVKNLPFENSPRPSVWDFNFSIKSILNNFLKLK